MVNSSELKEILSLYNHDIDSKTIEEMAIIFEYRNFNKGEIIVSNKGMCKNCYFLYSGFVRAYFLKNEIEHSLWFGERGDFLTSFKRMYNNEQSNEFVVAIEDCKILSIDMEIFKKLIKTNIEMANVYIKIVEGASLYWENRFLISSQLNANDRFYEWLGRAQHLSPYISLGELAQYLNIDQATLSRIRSKRK